MMDHRDALTDRRLSNELTSSPVVEMTSSPKERAGGMLVSRA